MKSTLTVLIVIFLFLGSAIFVQNVRGDSFSSSDQSIIRSTDSDSDSDSDSDEDEESNEKAGNKDEPPFGDVPKDGPGDLPPPGNGEGSPENGEGPDGPEESPDEEDPPVQGPAGAGGQGPYSLLFEVSASITLLRDQEVMTFEGRFFDGSKVFRPQIDVTDILVTIHLIPRDSIAILRADNKVNDVMFTGSIFSYTFVPPAGDWQIIGRVSADRSRGLVGGFWANQLDLLVAEKCRTTDCINVDGQITAEGVERHLILNITNNDKHFDQNFIILVQIKDFRDQVIQLEVIVGQHLDANASKIMILEGIAIGNIQVFVWSGPVSSIALSHPWPK